MSTDSTKTIEELPAPDDAALDALPEATDEETYSAAVADQKYTFQTWKRAASYREVRPGATPVGFLNKGSNYFYFQRKFNVKAVDKDSTGRQYYSTWWALTDDDKRNKRVWVSCIYFTGGANDMPVNGLPVK
jgi:eukaryotic-like serine/threonine-protein kinase